MTINTFSFGPNTSFSTQLNNNFKSNQIKVIYTSTGFDTSAGSGVTNNDDHELTSISSSDLAGADYLAIDILVYCAVDSDDLSDSYNSLQIQTKDIGGSYSDTFAKKRISSLNITTTGSPPVAIRNMVQIRWIHTLTANEKSAGVQVKILAESVGGASGTASLTNQQVVLSTWY